VKSYAVQWIKLVEKLDEAAFQRKHMFQVVIYSQASQGAKTDDEITLYLQAAVRVPAMLPVCVCMCVCLCEGERGTELTITKHVLYCLYQCNFYLNLCFHIVILCF